MNEKPTLAREFDAYNECRLEIGGPTKYRTLSDEEFNHVVACLTACDGIPREWLDLCAANRENDPEILEKVVGDLVQQRDALLKALEYIERGLSAAHPEGCAELNKARKAIAAAER